MGISKRNIILKTWDRCRSSHGNRGKFLVVSSKNSNQKAGKSQVAPAGCFWVYVGQERQRFVIKTKYANHPLFKMLLEDAEVEYGYSSNGPILLPCDVVLFYRVLAEMDNKDMEGDDANMLCRTRSSGFAYGSCSPFTLNRRVLSNGDMAKGFGSYGILTPFRLIKMN